MCIKYLDVYVFSYYSDNPAFCTTQVYIRNNIANIENLIEGMLASDCPLVPLESLIFTTIIGKITSPILIPLYSLYQPEWPLVLLSRSYTCSLF